MYKIKTTHWIHVKFLNTNLRSFQTPGYQKTPGKYFQHARQTTDILMVESNGFRSYVLAENTVPDFIIRRVLGVKEGKGSTREAAEENTTKKIIGRILLFHIL